jgi:hypothetical protein
VRRPSEEATLKKNVDCSCYMKDVILYVIIFSYLNILSHSIWIDCLFDPWFVRILIISHLPRADNSNLSDLAGFIRSGR